MLSLVLIGPSQYKGRNMELEKWKEKNEESRKYAHFDEKVSLNNIWNYISEPENIKRHGFYPFIHYEKKFNKYRKVNGIGEVQEKSRDLCYSAHVDRYIYSYYGYLINQAYDQYMEKRNLNMVSVAYRDNLGKNNIHFAKKAFDFIKSTQGCYIIIGDFSHFFDCLQHAYLKERLCEVLGVDILPEDYYAVFKNLTRYSTWELQDLLKLNNLKETEADIKKLNLQRRVLDTARFKANKSKYIHQHKEKYGIPQGSAMSAVLANVYMIKADEALNDLVTTCKGMYMRYSDDFIIVIPESGKNQFKATLRKIQEIINRIPKLTLQQEKTQIYKYDKNQLRSCNDLFLEGVSNGKNEIDYLGFTFDGKVVTIRDKTITKYYYRLYRKVGTIVRSKGYTPKGKRISCKNLYEKYTVKGSKIKGKDGKVKGNFITYVQRAQKIFGEEEPIDRKTRRHMLKVRRKLDKVF